MCTGAKFSESWRIRHGKSVLLRTIIGLVAKKRGQVEVFGHDMDRLNAQRRRLIERRWGILFQHGALSPR